MNATTKRRLLLALTLIAIGGVCLIPPIRQDLSYHDFADKRALWGLPNFANVVSNIPFLFVGTAGLLSLRRIQLSKPISSVYMVLFSGIFLTGLGSAYYHYKPDNDSLVFDRIPMTLVFMSLLCATVAELIDGRTGARLLIPLLLIGVISVGWWHYGETRGHGDLRLYGLVQFYPMIFIPLILVLFYNPAHKPALLPLCWVVVWYALAKIFELLDKEIYSLSGDLISGHTIKHLAAAASAWWLVKMFHRKYGVLPLPLQS